jgi:hypothetical protein
VIEDWPVEAAEDWLNTDAALPVVIATPVLAVKPALPVEYGERLKTLQAAWSSLSDYQRKYLSVWRECGLNGRKAERASGTPHSTAVSWNADANFVTVRDMWRAEAGDDALNRDRLLARHDDIVETLLTPKPILHQGVATGHMEVEAGAAAKANETLMRAAGVLKDKDIEVNVGLQGPSFHISVVQKDGKVIDATPKYVDVSLPPVDGT